MSFFTRELNSGAKLRVDLLAGDLVRVRIIRWGNFADTALNRYSFISHPDTGPSESTVEELEAGVKATTGGGLDLEWKDTGELIVKRAASGDVLLHQTGFSFTDEFSEANFAADKSEDWVGFGDQTRDRLYHRGHTADLFIRNQVSYVPVPCFMSTLGVGVLVNTTHRIMFDMCKKNPDVYSWKDRSGVIDYYIMAGSDLRSLISAYTNLTGKAKLPPLWSFGLWYICRTWANDREVVDDAVNMRREKIPCDVIGVEPGWMRQPGDKEKDIDANGFPIYNHGPDRDWNKNRFPMPPWATNGPHTFISALKRMGYHFEMWECCDYDLSYEEERRLGNPTPSLEEGKAAAFQEEGEMDMNFAAPRWLDGITRKEEAWFEHHKKFVDQGADFFKMDPAWQVMEHPDRLWGNGMTDKEMHNLYPLFYSRQMYEGFQNYTSRRPVIFTVAGWAGFQVWSGTWTGDTGGKLETLGAMLNTSIFGHSFCTNDMEVTDPATIHFGYLLSWAQINSWAYFRMPWIQGEKLLDMHRAYAQLRSRLVPYIYSSARKCCQEGQPLMSPLTLEWQDDTECRTVMNQFLLGRDLMVVTCSDSAYLPSGKWKDFWTGEVYEGAGRIDIEWPETRGGGLFLREGATIPQGPVMMYRGEIAVDPVEVLVFPGDEETEIEFYEDDGVTFKHEENEYAITEIRTVRKEGGVEVAVGATQGGYEGMPRERKWSFRIAVDFEPKSVGVNGSALDAGLWGYDAEAGYVIVEPHNGPLVVNVC